MKTRAPSTDKHRIATAAPVVSQFRQATGATMVDNRASCKSLAQMQQMANDSPRVRQLQKFAQMMDGGRPTVTPAPTQLEQGPNNTGLPDQLKAGIESLSGMNVSDVRVHRNSGKPAQLNAFAYAQGNDIHLGPGQEQHLPHEAWHVVQQRQGRVRETVQMAGVGVNDEAGLEREADLMGGRAASYEPGAENIGQSLSSAPVSPSVGAAVAQRRDMRAVMIDQRARQRDLGRHKGEFTTVGFEWDVAKTSAHSLPDAPNVLQGLTHVELARSTLAWNQLPYSFETDAGNVVEFVTPPFFVKTKGPGSTLPDSKDLQDIKDSTRSALTPLVLAGESLDDMMDKKSWADFPLGEWQKAALVGKIEWRNWSGPKVAESPLVIAQHLPTWGAITLGEVTLDLEPQINIATTASDFSAATRAGGSRLSVDANGKSDKDDFVDSHNKLATRIRRDIHKVVEQKLEDTRVKEMLNDEAAGDDEKAARMIRLGLFFDQVAQVLAQQSVVPRINELAKQQKAGFYQGTDVANPIRKHSGPPSYIKDTGMVWLKTDLFSYALATLKSTDWKLLGGDKGIMAGIGKKIAKTTPEKDSDEERCVAITQKLRAHAEQIGKLSVSAAKDKYLAEEFETIARLRPGFNEHHPGILGVRQDTFISPGVMHKLTGKLGHKSLLSVMEVRNTKAFLEWLQGSANPGSLKPTGEASAIKENEAAPTIDIEGGVLHPNTTKGDGNCFFHALVECRDQVRSTRPMQAQVRTSVVAALEQNTRIAESHFGPEGSAAPEYAHFAEEMVKPGAWITHYTPAIVSDALNWTIVIHRVDGSVLYNAVPNPRFTDAAPPHLTLHVQYTGNHYNSYTSVVLPP